MTNPSLANWTPGPWFFHEKLGRSLQYGVTAEKPYNPSVGAARRIAKCGSPYQARTAELDGEDRANARLIAAAPDMYEALKDLREAFITAWGFEPDESSIHGKALVRARAALAKAVQS